MNLKETETQLSLIMIGFLAYVLLPIVYWLWLEDELAAGAFPVNADSIGIPFAGFVILWFAVLVLAIVISVVVTAGGRMLSKARQNKLP